MATYRPRACEQDSAFHPIVEVIQKKGNRRIVRRRYFLKRYQSFNVEEKRNGQWVPSPHGPWDYLFNARRELHDPSMSWLKVVENGSAT